jgi:hypothetical protein
MVVLGGAKPRTLGKFVRSVDIVFIFFDLDQIAFS